MKKTASILTAMALTISISSTSVEALSVTEQINAQENVRLSEIFNMRIEELEEQANSVLGLSGDDVVDIEISDVVSMHDFSGNKYTLIECHPTGYMIYHDESANFVEGSAVAESPYKNCMGEIYYGGPNEYYEITSTGSDEVYCHTISGETLCRETLSTLSEASDKLNTALFDNANTSIQNYISSAQPLDIVCPMSVEVGDLKLVDNYQFFTGLDNCGYTTVNGSGICGYIAAGILLTYEQVTNGGNYVPSSYYSKNSSGKYSISTSLPKALYNTAVSLGYGTSTTSVEVHYTVEEYLANRGITVNHTSLYAPFGNNFVIADKIDNDRPVIWFGNVFDNTSGDSQTFINHAVVVYGYDYDLIGGYSYIAHFGWTGDTMVTFNGVVGSIYTFD